MPMYLISASSKQRLHIWETPQLTVFRVQNLYLPPARTLPYSHIPRPHDQIVIVPWVDNLTRKNITAKLLASGTTDDADYDDFDDDDKIGDDDIHTHTGHIISVGN